MENNLNNANIELLNEPNINGIKTLDYIWNNKYWELKTLKLEKSIDSALRKGIEQIFMNSGGVILDFETNFDNINQIEKNIKSRIVASCRFQIGIIILYKTKLKKIIRFN